MDSIFKNGLIGTHELRSYLRPYDERRRWSSCRLHSHKNLKQNAFCEVGSHFSWSKRNACRMPVKSVYLCILLNLCCRFPQALHTPCLQRKKKDWNRVLQLVRLTARAEIRSSHLLQGNLQWIYSTVANHSVLLISILPYLTALTQPPPGQKWWDDHSPSISSCFLPMARIGTRSTRILYMNRFRKRKKNPLFAAFQTLRLWAFWLCSSSP